MPIEITPYVVRTVKIIANAIQGPTGPQGIQGPPGSDIPVSRFGIEDITGEQDRSVNMENNDFDIVNVANVFIEAGTEDNEPYTNLDLFPYLAKIKGKSANTLLLANVSPDADAISLTVAEPDGSAVINQIWIDTVDAYVNRAGVLSPIATHLDVLRNVADGYAGLDSNIKIPAALLPAYVDDVLEYANLAAFPVSGTTGILYVALDTNKTYRWGGSSYTEISPSPGSTDSVPEGSINLYYTDARVNTVLATWPGTTNIGYVGTIGIGVWHGTPIADAYIASAVTWNAKQDALGYTAENLANKNIANGYAGLNASAKVPLSRVADIKSSLGVNVDGQGSVITTGQKGYIRVPYDCTVIGWSILADISGNCVFDVWKTTGALPTVLNTITGSAKPTLTTSTNVNSTTLTGWTTSWTAGDIIGWNVDSASTVTRIVLQILVTKT